MEKLFLFLMIFCSSLLIGGDKFYIWEFTTRDSEMNEHTRNITSEFETALQAMGCLSLLERRRLDKVIQHRDNEKAIIDVESIAPMILNELKTKQARGAIFGELFDDATGGEIRVQVKLQNFSTEIIGMASIRMRRGEIFDGARRDEHMLLLAKRLCGFIPGTASRAGAAKNGANQTLKSSFGDLSVTLESVRMMGNQLVVEYNWVLNGEDSLVSFYAGSNLGTSRAFIQGEEILGKEVKIGSQTGRVIKSQMVVGIRVNGHLRFVPNNMVSDARTVDLLELSGKNKGERFKIQFRDVPITLE